MIIILIMIGIVALSIIGIILGSIDYENKQQYFYIEDQKTSCYDDYKAGYKIKNYKKLGLDKDVCYKVKISYTRKYYFDFLASEGICGTSGGIGCFVLLLLIVCGCICIHKHSTWGVQPKEVAITEHITQLETEKINLMTYYEESINKDIDISSTNLPAKINDHNTEVREFIVDIKNHQIYAKNPWTSWFVNEAYTNVDLDRLTATYINLK